MISIREWIIQRRIKDIQPGDYVKAFNPADGRIKRFKIRETYLLDELIYLTECGKTLTQKDIYAKCKTKIPI